jgi:hypothetical protein
MLAVLPFSKPMARPGDAWKDPVIEAYKPGIDRTLLVEQLRRTPEERLRRIEDLQHSVLELAASRRRGS